MWVCSHQKKLDNRNEPVTWLHLCYRLANDSNAGINVSSIRAHKVETDVGIIHFVNVEHAARHERDECSSPPVREIGAARNRICLI